MEKDDKSQQELTEELARLRQQVADLQAERLLLQQTNQDALRESEIRFRTLAETTTAAIFIYQDNKNCYVNLSTETITGYSRDELLQMNFWDVIHPDFRKLVIARGIARQRGEEVPARYEIKLLTKDKQVRWVDFSGALIEFQGKPAVLGTAFDITERKRAEEERESLLIAEREQRLLAETLREVYLALAAQTHLEAVLDEILRQMQRLVPYNTANISLVENDHWRIVRWQGYQKLGSGELVAHFRQPLAKFPLLEQVIRSRQPLLIFDTAETPDWVILEKSAWIKSHIAVPICSQKRVLGFLQIDGDVPHKFSWTDIDRLQPLAHAAAVVLEKSRLYDQARQELTARRQIETKFIQRSAELLALQYGAAMLASTLDLGFILETFTREMANLIGVEGCTILEWDRVNDTVKIIAGYGVPNLWPEGSLNFPLADCPLAEMVLTGRRAEQLTLAQARQYPVELAYMQEHTVKALLMLPMEFQDYVVGVIEIMEGQFERVFTNEEIATAQMLANQAASAIQNAYLYDEVKQRLKEQIALQAATAAISSTLNLETVLSHIAEQMGRAVGATSAYICSYEPETMTSVVLAEYFSVEASAEEQVSDLGVSYKLPRDFSMAFERLLAGQPEEIHGDDLSVDAARFGYMQQFGVKTILNIPLLLRGQIIAFAELWESRHKRQFTLDEIALCQAIAQQAAIALEHARLYAQAQQEIQDRIKAEAELRQSEARQRALLNAIPDVIFRVTRTGQYLDYRRGSESDSIWPAEVQIGQNLQEILPSEIANLTLKNIGQVLETGVNQVFEFRWPLRRYFQDYETRLVVSGPEEVLVIVRNITKRKQMEEQAMQSERLATLGRLSAALTHEINNPLQSMRTHLDLMLDFALEPGEDEKFLRIMRQEVERLSQITRRILNLARPWPVLRRKVFVADLLQEVLILADKQLKQHQIRLTTDWTQVSSVLAAPDQLTQVFLNLLINAIEATPASGQLHIGVYPGPNEVIVSFVNNGPTIPSDVLPHIFEPFFTTKPEGSGLGLWVSHNLVRQHGGSITVENMGANQGVAFIVTLPTLPILEVIDDNAYLSNN